MDAEMKMMIDTKKGLQENHPYMAHLSKSLYLFIEYPIDTFLYLSLQLPLKPQPGTFSQ